MGRCGLRCGAPSIDQSARSFHRAHGRSAPKGWLHVSDGGADDTAQHASKEARETCASTRLNSGGAIKSGSGGGRSQGEPVSDFWNTGNLQGNS